MIEIRRERTGPGYTGVLEALAHRRRRRVLRLLDSVERLPVEDLVGALGAGDHRSPSASADADLTDVRVELQHRHLPKLVDAGLVTRSDDRASLAAGDALDDPIVDALLHVETDDWDDVLTCLSCPRRRAALSVLAATDGPMDVTALAFELAERAAGSDGDASPDADDVDEMHLELHHVHLPALSEHDLVALENGGTAVRYLGHPALDDLARTRGGADGVRRRIPL